MKQFKRIIVVFIIAVVTVVAFSPTVQASQGPEEQLGQPSPGSAFIDALFYRPVGLAAIPLGSVLFVATLPFSATGGNIGQSFDNLVVAPFKYTFNRPLGDI